MKKKPIKYIFHSEEVKFKPLRISFKKRFLLLLRFLFSNIVIAIGIVLFFIIGTPYERKLKQHNEYLNNRLIVLDNKINSLDKILIHLQEKDRYIYNTIFELKEDTTDIKSNIEYSSKDPTIDNLISKVDTLYKYSKNLDYELDVIREAIFSKNKLLLHLPAISPIKMNKNIEVASGFGYRIDPILKIIAPHEGLDFVGKIGTPIYCTGKGTVIETVNLKSGYGIHVIVDHGYGYKTLYAHLSKILVKVGQKIERGTKIGLLGNTGRSTGPHLHYEIIKNRIKINPISFIFGSLTTKQYDELINKASLQGQPLD